MVSCDDVRALQKQVNAYHAALDDSIAQMHSPGIYNAQTGTWEARDLGGTGERSSIVWRDLLDRCSQYEEESCTIGLFAGSQFDRGRALIVELDGWRDWLAGQRAATNPQTQSTWTVPAPVAVPQSDVGIAGGLAWAAAAVIGILLLREMR